MKKLKLDELDIVVDAVIPFKNEKYDGICIKWYGNIGFGEYNLYKENEEDGWHGDSECMDTNDDKAFLKLLMDKFIEQVKIEQ